MGSSFSLARSSKKKKKFPLLTLPNEVLFKIYSHLDYATRRTLRVNRRLAEIEKQTKYRCEWLEVVDDVDDVLITFDGVEVEIAHFEVKKELELIRENTTFNKISYWKIGPSVDRKSLKQICLFNAETIKVTNRMLNDDDLKSLVMNNTSVFVTSSALTENGIIRIYEKMGNTDFAGKTVTIRTDMKFLRSVMRKFGNFDSQTLQFTSTNPNQRIRQFESDEGVKRMKIADNGKNMRIVFNNIRGKFGRHSIQIYNK